MQRSAGMFKLFVLIQPVHICKGHIAGFTFKVVDVSVHGHMCLEHILIATSLATFGTVVLVDAIMLPHVPGEGVIGGVVFPTLWTRKLEKTDQLFYI